MRPQQQNRRMRGRNNNNNNNNNRKGPNPLTRNYESNGPDVKIRGSAQQIAEKYAALARDAQSAGDRVMAENYLQHAEHYNRIIAAAQAQMPIQQQVRDNRDELDDDLDDERDELESAPQEIRQQEIRQEIRAPAQPVDGSGPQPVIEGTPAEVALNQEQPAESNSSRETHANGNHVANGGEEEAQPRRPRRPRRARSRQDNANGEAGSSGEQPQGEAQGSIEAEEVQAKETSDPVPAN